MRILLDTNTFLFFALGSRRLSPRVRQLIEEQNDDLIVSAITPWELAVKAGAGRLSLPASADVVYRTTLAEVRGIELAVTSTHALLAGRLPAIHGDPFDRMLIAQAQVELLTVATNDTKFRDYGIDVIW